MTLLSPQAGYALWAPLYDQGANSLLALEERVLQSRLHVRPCERVLDLATGTGRWLSWLRARDAHAVGVDVSGAMLTVASAKPSLSGCLVQADLCGIPFRDDCADLAICSFGLSYAGSLPLAFREMARVARRVLISDMHPEAMAAGWTRSFRGDQTYTLDHSRYSEAELYDAAREAGLALEWSIAARFTAGDGAAYARAGDKPAVLVAAWRRA